MKIRNLVLSKSVYFLKRSWFSIIIFFVSAQMALADSGGSSNSLNTNSLGGLNTSTSYFSQFEVYLYGVLAFAAIIFLIYRIFQVWTEKKTWTDFAIAVVEVAVAGAVTAIGSYAFNLFAPK